MTDPTTVLESLTTLNLEELPDQPTGVIDPIGAVLGNRWRVRRMVGRGATGVVFEVEDVGTGQQAAMKILRPEYSDREMLVRRMAAEAVAMTMLQHPAIAQVYDMGVDGFLRYVVLEWADGGSVQSVLSQPEALDVERVVDIGLQVLDALAFVHGRGIVHRDVKPGNILLSGDRALLTDFGIARMPDMDLVETGENAVLGSLAYMPYEQRHAPGRVTRAVDVYAMGATLYRMSSGMSPADLFACGRNDERWNFAPVPLRPVLRRALQHRPEDRYPTAAAMAEDLRRVLAA